MDCIVKTVKFPSKNQQVLNSSLIITTGKTVTVKNLNQPEILKLFLESMVKESKLIKPGNNINHSHRRTPRLARYTYQSSCLGYWWLSGPLFQKTGIKRAIKGLLRLLFIMVDQIYCHDVPKEVKVRDMYDQFELHSKLQPTNINKFFILIKEQIKSNHPRSSLYY